MKELNSYELLLVSGGLDKDGSVAIGSVVGGVLGELTRIPGAASAGASLDGYVGGVLHDGLNQTITIPSVNVPANPNFVLISLSRYPDAFQGASTGHP